MSSNDPLVSIGLPVFNGEEYLREALDTLTAQDYGNFELIISDNASTDRTATICRDYAAKDPRIVYFCNETNVGPLKNSARVLDIATGKYFMLAAHDDVWGPSYLTNCVAALEDDPLKVLCCTSLRFINGTGTGIDIPSEKYDNPHLSCTDVTERISTLV